MSPELWKSSLCETKLSSGNAGSIDFKFLKDRTRKGDEPPDSCECMKPYGSQPDSLDWSTATLCSPKPRRHANSSKSLNVKAALSLWIRLPPLPSRSFRVWRSCGLWPSCSKAVLWCVWSQTGLWGTPTERRGDSLAHRQERDKAIQAHRRADRPLGFQLIYGVSMCVFICHLPEWQIKPI